MTTGPIPVAAPHRVHERLRAASDGPREVVHASGTAIYVDLDGWCLGLVSGAATRVPCALWSTLPSLDVLTGGLPRPAVRVRGGELVVGERAVRVARVVDVTAPAPGRHEDPRSAPEVLMTSGLDLAPGHLDRLVGRGPGLTPLGDDVLAGWLTTRAALGRPDDALAGAVRDRLGATTLLSATLLECAVRGEALPELSAWLADPTDAAERALLAVGATSGAGLLAGAALALASTTSSTPHPTPRRAA
ncbi:DUF2877 domain-containing protein [Nocardioides sp. zg-1228]|uniref:oxamate carbamoyltransferase subunit AllH family protein n=1 Tax=Nocardioides sp. zg-1228 TaxID=2763008 RepID=UPI001642B668|nr:DUF2877 domain-containing protein [Nocardioides sp. zg-1228]MBC2933918.1 DUF2877 domain-containing protein [Nocardioides sp. zg-1228]QSF58683.1 DUF2877 domain-containing protein [Nocardioides sp. zg-1228]